MITPAENGPVINTDPNKAPQLILPDLFGEDLSAGRTASPDLLSEDIEDRVQMRAFRSKAFSYASTACGGLIVALLIWLGWAGSMFLHGYAGDKSVFIFLTPLIILASLAAVIGLATLRFVFSATPKEKDDDKATIWQSLLKELSDVAKEYMKKH